MRLRSWRKETAPFVAIEETTKRFGYDPFDLPLTDSKKKLVYKCDICKSSGVKSLQHAYYHAKRGTSPVCIKCRAQKVIEKNNEKGRPFDYLICRKDTIEKYGFDPFNVSLQRHTSRTGDKVVVKCYDCHEKREVSSVTACQIRSGKTRICPKCLADANSDRKRQESRVFLENIQREEPSQEELLSIALNGSFSGGTFHLTISNCGEPKVTRTMSAGKRMWLKDLLNIKHGVRRISKKEYANNIVKYLCTLPDREIFNLVTDIINNRTGFRPWFKCGAMMVSDSRNVLGPLLFKLGFNVRKISSGRLHVSGGSLFYDQKWHHLVD